MKMSALRSRLDPNHKLGLCMQALQLALVSMSVALGGEAVRRLPFAYHRASVEEQVYTPPSYTLSYTPLSHRWRAGVRCGDGVRIWEADEGRVSAGGGEWAINTIVRRGEWMPSD
jgi:hypothetical protein